MVPGTLEHELIEIFASTAHERNREIVIGYYGWRDGRTHTLAEIGVALQHDAGADAADLCEARPPQDAAALPAPVTDRTLRFVAERLPAPVAVLEEALVREGLTAAALGLPLVQTAAALLGRHVPFAVADVGGRSLVVRPEHAEAPGAIVELAKKETYYHGLSTVGADRKRRRTRRCPRGPGGAGDRDTATDRRFCLARRAARLVPAAVAGAARVAQGDREDPGGGAAGDGRGAAGGRQSQPAYVALPAAGGGSLAVLPADAGCAGRGGAHLATRRDWRDVLTGVEAKLVEMLGAPWADHRARPAGGSVR